MEEELSVEQIERISELLAKGMKIEAIKVYQEATGKDLSASKTYIDNFCKDLARQDPEKYSHIVAIQGRGCSSFFILFLVVLLGRFITFIS